MKKIFTVTITLILLLSLSISVAAQDITVPYKSYTYSEADGQVVEGPLAYVPETVIYGNDLGIGNFLQPSDLDCDKEGNLYILDAGNNRVIVLNNELNFKTELKFNISDEDISLSGSKGITIEGEKLYICDTEKSRILIFNKNSGEHLQTIGTPKGVALEEDFIFKPTRVSVDEKGGLYVVSNGTFEGVLNLKPNGDFVAFFAANKVGSSAWDIFWRNFSTKEQRKKMEQLIPQDFSSIDIDKQGFFLITTASPVDKQMVKRANPGGTDVIRSLSKTPIAGDTVKQSSFIDISSGPEKIYACLDRNERRIFCYNNDGYLLYTFGGMGTQMGGFKNPISVTYLDDYRIAVLDTDRASVTVFNTTEYADAIHKGVKFQNELDYESAGDAWEEVLGYNANYTLAVKMIGTRYYEAGEYEKAKVYFKQCDDKEMYSAARRQLRTEWIYDNSWIIMLVVVMLGVLAAYFKIKEIRKERIKCKTEKSFR